MSLLFWSEIASHIMVLVFLAAGILLILGFRQAAGSLLGIAVLFAVVGPVIEGAAAGLDPRWRTLVVIVFGLMVLQVAAGLLFGRDTASNFLASLLYDLIRVPFRVVVGVVRGLTGHAR